MEEVNYVLIVYISNGSSCCPNKKKQKNYRTIGLILEAIRLSANFISSTKIEHVQTKKSKKYVSVN